MCVSYWSDLLFFFLPPSWRVLLLDCITCSAPVWLSLVGWWSFLASSEIPVRLSIPQPFHIPLTHPHPPSSLLMMVTKSFLFPDCSASVHKGCRDSLPACAKVKMKVHIPLACHFFSILSSHNRKWLHLFICLFDQLPKQQHTVPDPSSAPAVMMRNKCEFSSKPSPSVPV